MFKAAVIFHEARERGFALVAERRMAKIVREGNGLGQVGIQPQGAGDVARDGGDLDGMRQARAEMVAGAVEKNLRLVFETAEGARMDDAVAITLVMRAPRGRPFGMLAAAGVPAELGKGRENLPFDLFQFFSRARHDLDL